MLPSVFHAMYCHYFVIRDTWQHNDIIQKQLYINSIIDGKLDKGLKLTEHDHGRDELQGSIDNSHQD